MAKKTNLEQGFDHANLNNYKGVFYNQDTGEKYQDKVTGAHFEYFDMVLRLKKLQREIGNVIMDNIHTKQDHLYFPKEIASKLAQGKEFRNDIHKFIDKMYTTDCGHQAQKEIGWKSKEDDKEESKRRCPETNRQSKSITTIPNAKEIKNKEAKKKLESHNKRLSDLSEAISYKTAKKGSGERSNRSKSIEKSCRQLEAKVCAAERLLQKQAISKQNSYFTSYSPYKS
eukprot:TRINITY_DN10786_c0_g1_i6.p1 TRINITY_DN10786_c0_g1~~TRINITY_DN10786_c0_g1_i6.p1  ORF type:complete len:228 (-),score=51.92 TRINITY_DN10786_c0_g1_i6:636-1319(-)